MGKAPPSAYWDNVRLLLETTEDELIRMQSHLDKAMDSIQELLNDEEQRGKPRE